MIESQTVPQKREDTRTRNHIKPINTGTQMVLIESQTVPKLMEDSRTHHDKPIYSIKFQQEDYQRDVKLNNFRFKKFHMQIMYLIEFILLNLHDIDMKSKTFL